MKTKHFIISSMFARREGIPISFVGTVMLETERAIFVYGQGEMDPEGHCARCGRTLTHPGSILIGIGPECLGDWGARDDRLSNMSKADEARLRALISQQKVDCWLPKGVVKKTFETKTKIKIPKDHRIIALPLIRTMARTVTPKKTATLAKSGLFEIRFPYDEDTLNQVRKLDARKYVRKEDGGPYWTCPVNMDNAIALREAKFELIGLDKKAMDKLSFDPTTDVKPIEVPTYKKKLYPFQKEGVSFIEAKNGRALIGDEMGLGKTIQALAYLELHPKYRPAIIVCPASLKLNWAQEIQDGMTKKRKVQIAIGRFPDIIGKADIIIINYDILPWWVEYLLKFKPKVVIADECHYFKSNQAKRTKAIKKLGKGVPHFIALSGTPIVNRPIEIYNAVNIIDATAMPSFFKYAKRYCNAKHNGFGWDFGGASNTQELHEKLTKSIMIRRKKSDVLKDLPDKVRSFIPFELDNPKQYKMVENDFINFIRATKGDKAAERVVGAEVLAQIEALKQAAVAGKMKGIIAWVHNFLEQDEKLVLFATHKKVIDKLMKEFGKIAVKIDGSVDSSKRQGLVHRFQTEDQIRLFVGNIKAAGVGSTLTASSNVAFIEFPWTPGELSQAEDRLHRIGQKESVTVYYLLADHTIERDIAYLLDTKRKVLDAVLDGKVTEEDSLLIELINKYKK